MKAKGGEDRGDGGQFEHQFLIIFSVWKMSKNCKNKCHLQFFKLLFPSDDLSDFFLLILICLVFFSVIWFEKCPEILKNANAKNVFDYNLLTFHDNLKKERRF